MRPNPSDLRRILASGILAPSAENKHYLRFQVRDDSVRLLATDWASWADQPHRQLLALLSYGAVLENLALRSVELGFELQSGLLPHADDPQLIADLHWIRTTAPADPLSQAIEDRHTNRRFYRRVPLPPQTLARLTASVEGLVGTQLIWLDDPVSRARALQGIRLAETQRFRCRALHHEMFDAIRFDQGWQRTTDEWLPPAALQVEPPLRWSFAQLRHWPVMRAATCVGAHWVLGLRAGYLPCALAPHLGLLVASRPRGDRALLQAGHALQRLWLAATTEGLALQPMATAPALIRQRPGHGWVPARVKARLEHLFEDLCRGQDVQPCMFFRVGQADAPSAVTGRLPIDHYIDGVFHARA